MGNSLLTADGCRIPPWNPAQLQVYVVPFDATKVLRYRARGRNQPNGGKYQISASGGVIARWRGDGKEIFYFGPGNQMMAAEVDGRGNSFASSEGAGSLQIAGRIWLV